MSKYGQSNRQVVQDTNAGIVDPPVTEVSGSQSSVKARRTVDRNVGQSPLASALVESAGTYGQMATKERHRRERIEGAKLVADGQAEAYINETEPTFAEKLFGPKPKMRVAQEMQVEQEVNTLDDAMRKWVEETGHKEDSAAFQAKYDEEYKKIADRYDDDRMKDLVAATYAKNLERTRRDHAKAKDLFDQQHLRDTTMKGWAEQAPRIQRDLNSSDPQVASEALDRYREILKKPEGMSEAAYKSAAFDFAKNEIALGRTEGYAVLDEMGAFDDL